MEDRTTGNSAMQSQEYARKVEKPTYEQLAQTNVQMYQQLQRLAQENQMLKDNHAMIRANLLLEVIKLNTVFDLETVKKAVMELTWSLYPPEDAQSQAVDTEAPTDICIKKDLTPQA